MTLFICAINIVMNDTWLYKNKEFVDAPEDCYGFVYKVTNNVTGQKYIGKKIFWNTVTRPPLKGKKRKRKIKKESDWKKYYGSSEYVKEDLKELGKENFTREILVLCETKGQSTYFETYLQWKYDVLYSRLPDGEKEYYNSNIGGKYFWKEDVEKIKNML